MRVLVTGVTGFVGPHLVRRLRTDGWTVVGVGRRSTFPEADVVYKQLEDLPKTTSEWDALLDWARVSAIVHLAARSRVGESWADPVGVFMSNTVTAVALIDSVRRRHDVRQLITVGSAEEYGPVPQALQPITEDTAENPVNPYALTKYIVGQTARVLLSTSSVLWYHVRPFNHFGPGQPQGFVLADLASQVAAAERGRQINVLVGDPTIVRDFLPVEDVVAAYSTLLRAAPPPGVYNVASGIGRSIAQVAEDLMATAGIQVLIQRRPGHDRPQDVPVLVGSAQKLTRETGWTPQVTWSRALTELLEWWRAEQS
jgi:GDP-4-dehydro-6-deoxy-D-mannose reductase